MAVFIFILPYSFVLVQLHFYHIVKLVYHKTFLPNLGLLSLNTLL